MTEMSLIVNDDYIKEFGEFLQEQSKQISDAISTYIRIMTFVKNNGIKQGKTAEALEEFISQVKSGSGKQYTDISSQGTKANRFCATFVDKIDDADKDLY